MKIIYLWGVFTPENNLMLGTIRETDVEARNAFAVNTLWSSWIGQGYTVRKIEIKESK